MSASGGGQRSTSSGSEIETLSLVDLGLSWKAGYDNGNPSLPTSFSVNQMVGIPWNTDQPINLVVSAGLTTPFGGTANAYIDPTFTIDPGFAGAADFTIEFSPDLSVRKSRR